MHIASLCEQLSSALLSSFVFEYARPMTLVLAPFHHRIALHHQHQSELRPTTAAASSTVDTCEYVLIDTLLASSSSTVDFFTRFTMRLLCVNDGVDDDGDADDDDDERADMQPTSSSRRDDEDDDEDDGVDDDAVSAFHCRCTVVSFCTCDDDDDDDDDEGNDVVVAEIEGAVLGGGRE